jgi:hypothetical protein
MVDGFGEQSLRQQNHAKDSQEVRHHPVSLYMTRLVAADYVFESRTAANRSIRRPIRLGPNPHLDRGQLRHQRTQRQLAE